jgi:hypothetical protein
MNAEIIAALNALLEEERATVDALVALVSMATDTLERQALTTMGGQAVQGCIDLREHLEDLGAPIGQRVSPSIGRILSPEHLDDRLRAFSALRLALAGRCLELRAEDLDPETWSLLTRLREVQLAHAAWSERRAAEFAASRPEPDPALAPFGGNHLGVRGERSWPPLARDSRSASTPRGATERGATERDDRHGASDHAALDGSASAVPPTAAMPPTADVPVATDIPEHDIPYAALSSGDSSGDTVDAATLPVDAAVPEPEPPLATAPITPGELPQAEEIVDAGALFAGAVPSGGTHTVPVTEPSAAPGAPPVAPGGMPRATPKAAPKPRVRRLRTTQPGGDVPGDAGA